MIRSVWAQHYAHLSKADRDAAGKRAAEMLVQKTPRAKLLELNPRLKGVSSIDIAMALGDVQEDRRCRATQQVVEH